MNPPKQAATGLLRGMNAAFTLVELLVCIAVVAILVGLITVGVARGHAKARQVHCLSNLRQHGVALAVFVSEQSAYPLVVNPGQRITEHGISFLDALKSSGLGPVQRPATPNGVYFCPSFLDQLKGEAELNNLAPFYGYNVDGLNGGATNLPLGLGLNWNPETQSYVPVKESLVVAPSRMFAIGDGVKGWNKTYQDSAMLMRQSDSLDNLGSTRRVKRRHGGNLNVLFCDGHVVQESLQFLFNDPSDTALSCWNRDNQPHSERIK
jgi:prepilin-type processing-associated H-X9-DG protein/prepilin-type N-terminal cleavage/methylation domain-containing protein